MRSDERTARDWQYIVAMARQLTSLNEKMLTAAMDRGDTRLKAAAILSCTKYGDKYVPDLIERVGDGDPYVCQCSRHSLMVISNMYMGGRMYVDFGPLPNDDEVSKNAASIMWKVWFDDAKDCMQKQQGKSAAPKQQGKAQAPKQPSSNQQKFQNK